VISVTGSHGHYLPRTPKNLATPPSTRHRSRKRRTIRNYASQDANNILDTG